MNLETVLKCAKAAANMQLGALGHVQADIQSLIDEVESLLAPVEVVEEAPAPKAKKGKSA